MKTKITLSTVILLGALYCFYFAVKAAVLMIVGPTDVVATVGLAGASSFQIWQILSLFGFIAGLGLLAFLRSYWK
ncbi:MAG: hypothetical protein B6D72_05340 [gamma proteobacterium symbiont of Ctena orbiculata]|uniref:Uncharacterized protein n=1 Tax=Candidatus Thiodiazotropha taylori TaxID=2792791 RepID=A0A944QTX3_9GAMM|nr:hypothetical protein [Candidatus Thiodiazotropha taylori]PVV13681.1 MAG: hypothetical protein B6D72_05340 [gamma proteobacterium symbiont of Ctena orbiculata]MBT2988354.1 hypothetical protein [Candidatus Thiodiazotropha taylori]MBT2997261.1 hypothetical protein [Candidatus Thiodiazotropha taylori]MBT3001029.1 hypothetical protein [Candidatus Thiodiazotropha taylori]